MTDSRLDGDVKLRGCHEWAEGMNKAKDGMPRRFTGTFTNIAHFPSFVLLPARSLSSLVDSEHQRYTGRLTSPKR